MKPISAKFALILTIFALCCLSVSAAVAGSDFAVTYDDGVTIHYRITDPENRCAQVMFATPATAPDVIIPSEVNFDGNTFTVNSIASGAFYYCSALKSITIPPTVTEIGSAAFVDCFSLTRVNITDIAAWCNIQFEMSTSNPLYYASHLYVDGQFVERLVIPEGVTAIAPYAFWYCSGLKAVTLPDSLISIGTAAFCGCSGLTSADIPDSVTTIDESSFSTCKSLISITLGRSLNYIGSYAFYGCKAITDITIAATTPPFATSDTFLKGPDTATAVIVVPYGTATLYSATAPWSQFRNITESSPTSLPIDADDSTFINAADGSIYYDLQGRRLTHPHTGLNIIIHNNRPAKTFIQR